MNNRIPEDLIERAYQGKSTKEDGLLFLEVPPFELFRFADELRSLTAGDTV
ncbi:MAG TPA: 7,8-didemethyl-8-hydroxy-5-deazariboflavin synthase subunit CofH, partial [Methanosarcina vacuolata]|nr:7,8-didemethyl-8-hydroxy-5-deazariboflavin synthase subunit CofH [Methanosarcina vacuolata]